MNEFQILSEIRINYPDVYDGYYPFPAPFRGQKPVKFIILGTDPGNKIKSKTVRFNYVFGLKNQESPYFMQISKNLNLLENIDLDEIYVQNVCKCYFNVDSGKNKFWNEIAFSAAPNDPKCLFGVAGLLIRDHEERRDE